MVYFIKRNMHQIAWSHEETERARQCKKVERCFFYWSDRCRVQGNHSKSTERWKFRLKQLCFARSEEVCTVKTVALLAFARQNTHASWKPTNLRDSVWKKLYVKIMKTILQERGSINSLSDYNLVHKLIPMPQAKKILEATVAVEKEWENSRKYRRGKWRKSEARKMWSMKRWTREEKFILRHWRTSVIWRIRSWNIHIRNVKVEWCFEVS